MSPLRDHAIVMGASVAGMCAASALSESFPRVTLIDRDRVATAGDLRRGVPQARHVHGLLVRGRQELGRHFPGFSEAMLAGGALDLDFGESFATLRSSRWVPRAPIGLSTLCSSRDLLESVLRRLLARIPNVTTIEASVVDGLVVERDRVAGVRLRDGAPRELRADLVIDASGRASSVDAWLADAGVRAPPVDEVDGDVGYGTRWYKGLAADRRPPEWWWKGLWIEGAPPHGPRIGGTAYPIEGDRMQVTVVGFTGDYPPSDEAELLAFLRRLRSPLIARLVERLEPISPVYTARRLVNRFRRYDRWRAELRGFAAVGDAVCSFNPVYGQGMTTAAMSGALLRVHARSYDASAAWTRDFHAAQAKALADPWALATGADFRWPGTRGERPIVRRLLRPYTNAVLETGWGDPLVHAQIQRVLHMLAPASTLYRPWIAGRVLHARDRRREDRGKAAHGFADVLPPGGEGR